MSFKADGMSASKVVTEDKVRTNPDGRANATPGWATKSGSNADKQPPSRNETRKPNDNDVLCGRGGSSNNHPGNANFRQLVELRRRVYLTAQFKREKRLVADSIVSDIRNQVPPGRFLSWDAKTGIWFDIGNDKARDKTSQALREKARFIRAQVETEMKMKRAALVGGEKTGDEKLQASLENPRMIREVMGKENNEVPPPPQKKRVADNWDDKPLAGQALRENAWPICAEMETETDTQRAEMTRAPKEETVARTAHLGHYHSSGGRTMHWGYYPQGSQAELSDNYPQGYDHHHQNPIRLVGSDLAQRSIAAHDCYRDSHSEHSSAHLPSFHPSKETLEERESAFPSSFSLHSKPSLSFSSQASSHAEQGGGHSEHSLPMDESSGGSVPRFAHQPYPPTYYARDGRERRWVHFESPSDERGPTKIRRRHYHRSHSFEDLPRVNPPGSTRDGRGRRSVHFESPDDERCQSTMSTRSMQHHRSRSYDCIHSSAQRWEYDNRGQEWNTGEPECRSSFRHHEHQGLHHNDHNLEQRERQRDNFSPLPVLHQNTTSSLYDMTNHSWEQHLPQAPPPSGSHDTSNGHASWRAPNQQHQRPLSPNEINCHEAEEPVLDPLLVWWEKVWE